MERALPLPAGHDLDVLVDKAMGSSAYYHTRFKCLYCQCEVIAHADCKSCFECEGILKKTETQPATCTWSSESEDHTREMLNWLATNKILMESINVGFGLLGDLLCWTVASASPKVPSPGVLGFSESLPHALALAVVEVDRISKE